MPIEIRELVIRAVVGGERPAPSQDGPHSQLLPAGQAGFDMEQLVQECVRQVMLALARERDR